MDSLTLEFSDWQQELQRAICHPAHLLQLLELPEDLMGFVPKRFSLRVPRGYVAKMRKGDPHDPLLRQVLPLVDEQQHFAHFTWDPTGDKMAEKIPNLLHKYHGRALLITTGACAIHCRYCFRQHYPYSAFQIDSILNVLREETSITEIILSGGDPLTWTDKRLTELIHTLATLDHLKRLRLHSRLPIVLPQRITFNLLKVLTETRLQPILVVHANHPNEIDVQVGQGLRSLVEGGITVLNQSVLLRGVNNHIQILTALSEVLFTYRVLPYYLHLLDRIHGAAHFEVPQEDALELLKQLRINLPGYLVPRMVREIPGTAFKQPLC